MSTPNARHEMQQAACCRPGPQPHNRIAGTAAEQLRRVFGLRPATADELRAAEILAAALRSENGRRVLVSVLLDALAPSLAEAIAAAVRAAPVERGSQ